MRRVVMNWRFGTRCGDSDASLGAIFMVRAEAFQLTAAPDLRPLKRFGR